MRYDIRAYLHMIRNVQRGLCAREGIIREIEGEAKTTAAIAKNKELSYGAILYHLRNMEREGIVHRTDDGLWTLSSKSQMALTEFQ